MLSTGFHIFCLSAYIYMYLAFESNMLNVQSFSETSDIKLPRITFVKSDAEMYKMKFLEEIR